MMSILSKVSELKNGYITVQSRVCFGLIEAVLNEHGSYGS